LINRSDARCLTVSPIPIGETHVTSGKIARRHFDAAVADADAAGIDLDALCRSLLGLVVAKCLEKRAVSDVQAELRFVADNCDPDTDHIFMRP